MSELSDLEGRLVVKLTGIEQGLLAFRWYVFVALSGMAVGFLLGHFH